MADGPVLGSHVIAVDGVMSQTGQRVYAKKRIKIVSPPPTIDIAGGDYRKVANIVNLSTEVQVLGKYSVCIAWRVTCQNLRGCDRVAFDLCSKLECQLAVCHYNETSCMIVRNHLSSVERQHKGSDEFTDLRIDASKLLMNLLTMKVEVYAYAKIYEECHVDVLFGHDHVSVTTDKVSLNMTNASSFDDLAPPLYEYSQKYGKFNVQNQLTLKSSFFVSSILEETECEWTLAQGSGQSSIYAHRLTVISSCNFVLRPDRLIGGKEYTFYLTYKGDRVFDLKLDTNYPPSGGASYQRVICLDMRFTFSFLYLTIDRYLYHF